MSGPATVEVAKAANFYGLVGKLMGTATRSEGMPSMWSRLPREQWPIAWAGMKDPVYPSGLAVDGRPEAGGWSEDRSKRQLEDVGFVEISGWRACYRNGGLNLI